MMRFGGVVLSAVLLAGGCAVPAAPSLELGSPMPTPALERQASGGRSVPARVAWQVAVPKWLTSPLTVQVVGPWFTVTSLGPAQAQSGRTVTVALGRLRDGKFIATQVLGNVIAQPFFFVRRERPMVLVNSGPSGGGAGRVQAVDLLDGTAAWTLGPKAAGAGAQPAAGGQFSAVATSGGLLVGQYLARAASQPECAICALRVSDGSMAWSHEGNVMAAGMAILSTTVRDGLVGTQLGELHASTALLVEASSGRILARRPSNWSDTVMQNAQVVTGEGMVLLEQRDDKRTRVAIAVDRAGRVTWTEPATMDPVVAAGDIVVLTTPDGGFLARRISGRRPLWRIPAAQGVSDGVSILAASGEGVVGTSSHEAIILDAATGRPKFARWFQPADPRKWSGRLYLGWNVAGQLTAYAGDSTPVGIDTTDGGEVPVFVSY